MHPLLIVLIAIAGSSLLFLIVVLCIGRYYFKTAFSRRKNDATFSEDEAPESKYSVERNWLWSNPIEELEITSFDKLKLKGYILPHQSDKLVILIHGYHGRYYSMTKQAKFLYENGYDILMINHRCHDSSEGKFFTMGKFECRDIKQWIELMVKRNPKYNITLFGVSMGAHIVMMMEGYILSPNVSSFIADSGYSSLYTQLVDTFAFNHPRWISRFVTFCGNLYCEVFHHFSFRDDTKNAFRKATIPTLFMASSKDSQVPPYNLEILLKQYPRKLYKKSIMFKGDDHLQSVHNQYDLYKDTVLNFIKEFNR